MDNLKDLILRGFSVTVYLNFGRTGMDDYYTATAIRPEPGGVWSVQKHAETIEIAIAKVHAVVFHPR